MATKLIMIAGILLLDILLYFYLKDGLKEASNRGRQCFKVIYWGLSGLVLVSFWNLDWIFLNIASYSARKTVIGLLGMNIAVKIVLAIYALLDRLIKGLWGYSARFRSKQVPELIKGKAMSRKRFLYKAAVMTASIPLASKSFGIVNKAYEYRVRRQKVLLPHLPKAFHGLTIGQISDIHTGSFNNKVAVQGGVDLLAREKVDVVFFTGDLVNQQSDEVNEYFNTFKKVKAPLGVYSVLGNHDYGDYRSWPSLQAKKRNFQDMLKAHQELGWQLLRNENHLLHENSESLAIIGVDNWGIKRFSKYGKIDKAYEGTENAGVKLLLSHDPSHWDAQVLDYKDIDITFSGHTHGFQFGVEIGNFKWSPSQYLYKQWAGLYQSGAQYLYVNRGYGFIGIPGRIGINPEITIFELVRS